MSTALSGHAAESVRETCIIAAATRTRHMLTTISKGTRSTAVAVTAATAADIVARTEAPFALPPTAAAKAWTIAAVTIARACGMITAVEAGHMRSAVNGHRTAAAIATDDQVNEPKASSKNERGPN